MPEEQRPFLFSLLVNIVAHFLYVLGLSVLIPIIFLLFFPEHLWEYAVYTKPLLYASIGLVIGSAILLYFYKGSIGRTFFSLGLMTLIPGALALLFSIYNQEIIFTVVKGYVAQFELIEPFLTTYLEHSLPRVWALTISYLVIGIILLWAGISFLRKEYAGQWFREAFGYRP